MFCVLFLTEIDDQHDVESEVIDIAPEWKGFGLALRLAPPLLNKIEKESGSNVDNCLKNVISMFLQQKYDISKYGCPTWRKIIQAVKHRTGGSNPALAFKIANNHLKGSNYSKM